MSPFGTSAEKAKPSFVSFLESKKLVLRGIFGSKLISIVRIRHYDDKGNAYKDVDYTDHGTPEIHKVPHTHEIIIKDGNIHKRK